MINISAGDNDNDGDKDSDSDSKTKSNKSNKSSNNNNNSNSAAADKGFGEQMIEAGIVPVLTAGLREKTRKADGKYQEMVLMLLTNLTRSSQGQVALMQEGHMLEGLELRRLIQSFVLPSTLAEDPYRWVAHILINVSQRPACRTLLLDKERGTLHLLFP